MSSTYIPIIYLPQVSINMWVDQGMVRLITSPSSQWEDRLIISNVGVIIISGN